MNHFVMICIVLFVAVASVAAQDTVQVKAGWNIIGSVKAGAIPEVLTTIPGDLIASSFWGYTPGVGYVATDTLGNGIGYWVKVSADGVIVFNTSGAGECGVMTVEWEGKTYRTERIGSQCWLDRNLDVGTRIDAVTNQTDNSQIEKYCYNNDTLKCAIYGGLYQWNEAMQYDTIGGVQGICPTGWHIPTLAEFQTLSTTVGDEGNALKALGQGTDAGAGTNTSGFSGLLAGHSDNNGYFYDLGNVTYTWSTTESGDNAHLMVLFRSIGLVYWDLNPKTRGYSVRCLKD